ncbi:MAG: large repetitive protein, partial [Solirubrobacteraceae bacterium]|nr:large repetitive protein [Solirubrobacteraceae bacterium]
MGILERSKARWCRSACAVTVLATLLFAMPAGAAAKSALSATNPTGKEGTTVKVTVKRASTSRAAAIKFATKSGTARAGSDFVSRKGTVHFRKGQKRATIALRLKKDSRVERRERFTVAFSRKTRSRVLARAKVTIVDANGGSSVKPGVTGSSGSDPTGAGSTGSRPGAGGAGGDGEVPIIGPAIAPSPTRLVFNDVQGGGPTAAKSVAIRNPGTETLTVSTVEIAGANANQFHLLARPSNVAPGSTEQVQVSFEATTVGPKRATMTLASNDPAHPQVTIALRGLGTKGVGGTNEPSLQWILDTYDIPIKTGDPDPTDNALPSSDLLGDEVPLQRLQKAGPGSVTIEPLAIFGPPSDSGEVTNVGWYPATGARTTLFSVANASAQSLDPVVSGSRTFDPGSGAFSMSTIWPFFSNREVFSEDARNGFDPALAHHMRAYPLKSSDGTVVANSYVIAFEESTSGYDFQDVVAIMRNVRPPGLTTGSQISVTNLDGAPFDDRMVFNRIGSLASPPTNVVHDRSTMRISNTSASPLTINSLTLSGPWSLVDPPALPATIGGGGFLDVTVRFMAQSTKVHLGSLTIDSSDATAPSGVVTLAGWWQRVSEGGQELSLTTMMNTEFGFRTTFTYADQSINRHGQLESAGEEVLSPYWTRVDPSRPVSVRQLAAFHTQGNTATLRWHARGSTALNSVFTHAGIEGQSFLPHLNANPAFAAGSFSPPGSFGLKIDTEWSDETKNATGPDVGNGCVMPCGHHVRFWPARDGVGVRIPDSWIVSMDYSGVNYDYNDNVYLMSNMKPDWIGPVLARVDVGGSSDYTDVNGDVWRPDTGLFSPASAPIEGANTVPLEIDRTTDDPIYRTYRGNVGSVPQDQRTLSFALPTGSATSVDLRLHFAERAAGNSTAGRRVQDISAEGALVRDNFDIFAATGGQNRAYILALN